MGAKKPGHKNRGFTTSEELNELIDSDPIPLQSLLESYLRWRYGLSNEPLRTLAEDLQAIDFPKGLTVRQVAKILDRQVQTIRDRYIAQGKLKANKTPSKQLSIDPKDLLDFVEANEDNFSFKIIQDVRELAS